MRDTLSYIILIIVSTTSFVINAILYYFLLGFSSLPHEAIPIAWLHIGVSLGISMILYIQAFITMRVFKAEILSRHFFFIISIFVFSLLPILQLFMSRFNSSLDGMFLVLLARVVSFLYILAVLCVAGSLAFVNLKYRRNAILFLLLVSFSAFFAKVGIIGYSRAAAIYDMFLGGSWLLAGIGFAICIIFLAIYCIDLIRLKIRTSLIVRQVIFLLFFLVALHAMLLFSEVLIIVIVAAVFITSSLLGYLRGIFIHSF